MAKKKTKKDYGYVGFTLPKRVLEPVRKVVNSPDSRYTSITDFLKEAIREKIERIEMIEASLKVGDRD